MTRVEENGEIVAVITDGLKRLRSDGAPLKECEAYCNCQSLTVLTDISRSLAMIADSLNEKKESGRQC